MVTLELIKAIPRVGRNLLSDLSTAHDMYARCLLLLVMVKVFFCICVKFPGDKRYFIELSSTRIQLSLQILDEMSCNCFSNALDELTRTVLVEP